MVLWRLCEKRFVKGPLTFWLTPSIQGSIAVYGGRVGAVRLVVAVSVIVALVMADGDAVVELQTRMVIGS